MNDINLTCPSNTHVFYHADRAATLKENSSIDLDEIGLSYFGKAYWPHFNKNVDEMSDNLKREFYLEQVRMDPQYHLYCSRLQAIFAANTIDEAIVFANSIQPKPKHPIPIIEIHARRFWNLDSNWLDYINSTDKQAHYRSYWDGRISNHHPVVGERRPPRIEVMIALPATTGRIVHTVILT